MNNKDIFKTSGFYTDTDMSVPSATVIVNCYNHEPYLYDCLEGILLQRANFSFDVIVADDFSTDNSRQIIDSYVEKFPSVFKTSYTNRNYGGAVSFGKALAKATGKYLFIIDGDDFWTHTKCMQHKVDFLEENRGIHMCSSSCVEFHMKDSSVIREEFGATCYYSFEELLCRHLCGNVSRNCFRMSTLRAYGELPEPMLYDLPLALLMANKGLVAKLPEYHSTYRVTGRGVWSRLSEEEKKQQVATSITHIAAFFSHRIVSPGVPPTDSPLDVSGKELVKELVRRIRQKNLKELIQAVFRVG